MVRQLHDAGIEVILDVVYNHTAEGNHLGPTLSFRGIDNASYYRLQPTDRRYYINETGTGNTLNLSHPRVLQMVLDSLRYWVTEMHVDGFRFDLASTLGREPNGFDPGSGFFDAIRQAPWLTGVKLIAEPWDIGPGGYQLGHFPPGWAEWNDRYRDTVRRYWRGDQGVLPELAARISASADLFDHQGRRPWATVNFVAAHDGFTLADLVSYNEKHNEANKENNQDGHTENFSSNYGVEGPTDDPAIVAVRERQKRNMLALLLLSQLTPILLGRDEIARTQQGNSNAYSQHNRVHPADAARGQHMGTRPGHNRPGAPCSRAGIAHGRRFPACGAFAGCRRNSFAVGKRECAVAVFAHAMPFGAELRPDGSIRFRLWAAAQQRVSVALLDRDAVLPLCKQENGWFELVTDAAQGGSRYRLELQDGMRVPDPASRYQPEDVHGPSVVIDPRAYSWRVDGWRGRPWHEAIFYELHVGSFGPEGDFDGVRRRLDQLERLGATAIELMPLADFPGRRNWGYDGVLPFAPDASYGTPAALNGLFDAAHQRGLMIFLDVVS